MHFCHSNLKVVQSSKVLTWLLCCQAWARLCKCLGQDFLPYMGFVMPRLLQSAQLKPDVTITSADSDAEFDEDDDDRCPFNSSYRI